MKLPKTNQINVISTFVAAESSLLILAVKPIKDGISIELLGTKGLIAAFLVAFIVPNIYKFCIGRNITIKMPPQVPGNIAQAFKDMIPFAFSVSFFWIVDIVVRAFSKGNTAELVTNLLSPLFRAANGYLGFAIIFGFMAFFWFIGVHGPSVVGPAVIAIMYNNQVENLRLFRAGEHAHYALTQSTQDFVALIGGTGATLLVPKCILKFQVYICDFNSVYCTILIFASRYKFIVNLIYCFSYICSFNFIGSQFMFPCSLK